MIHRSYKEREVVESCDHPHPDGTGYTKEQQPLNLCFLPNILIYNIWPLKMSSHVNASRLIIGQKILKAKCLSFTRHFFSKCFHWQGISFQNAVHLQGISFQNAIHLQDISKSRFIFHLSFNCRLVTSNCRSDGRDQWFIKKRHIFNYNNFKEK